MPDVCELTESVADTAARIYRSRLTERRSR